MLCGFILCISLLNFDFDNFKPIYLGISVICVIVIIILKGVMQIIAPYLGGCLSN